VSRAGAGGRKASPALGLYTAFVLLILYLPILIVLVLSVNDSPVTGFPFRGFTLRWFAIVFDSPALLRAIGNSLGLGIASATIATALALALALAFRQDIRFKAATLNLLLIPIIVPGIVAGATIFVLFQLVGIPISLWTSALCAHVTCVLPFAFLNIQPRLHNFDRSIEEAAADLGASRSQTVMKVILPVIAPGIAAAWLFAFSLSFDEFVRTLLLTSYDRTLPIQFWYMVVESLAPEAPALAVVIIVISLTASLVGFAATTRASAKA
jgi:ABC-type spermidine/putrescine transport system permease subunit II